MRILLATVCAFLASVTIRLGWVEISARADAPAVIASAVTRAAGIEESFNADRLEYLAEVADASGESGRARALLGQATLANPRQVSAWLARGFQAERAGDLAEAEADLNQAAKLDRQYLPAWTLANFYFRRGNRQAFWPWAERAAHMTYDDFRPLFRLCEVFEPDAAVVMDRLGDENNPGGESNMLRAYVFYLAGEGRRLGAAEIAAWRLIARHDPDRSYPDERPAMANLITREISAGRLEPAVALWSAAYTPLDPRQGPVVTNGDLREKPSGEGFDWSLPACEGLVSEWQPGRLAFHLNGREADDCILLDQPIPVAKKHTYRLLLDSSVEAQPPHDAGIHWEICGAGCQPAADCQSACPPGAFNSPGDALLHLKLVCRRAPGHLPFEGRVQIRNVRLEVQ